MAAIVAEHEAAQREVGIDVRAGRRFRAAIEALLNPAEGLVADQTLVPALAQGDVPGRHLDIAGIDRLGQQVANALRMDGTGARIARELGEAFEEALDLGLRFQAARGEAFERLLDEAGKRLVADQQLALAGGALVLVADGHAEGPVAVQHPGAHAVDGLLAVLLPLVLRHAGQQVLDQDAVGILAELDRG
ncbi:MAG TPA: hypothetical protein PKA13_21980 [Geminicoccaceae bacterium]|nr:hypothetical protein [Geminicoccaceae bacterium]